MEIKEKDLKDIKEATEKINVVAIVDFYENGENYTDEFAYDNNVDAANGLSGLKNATNVKLEKTYRTKKFTGQYPSDRSFNRYMRYLAELDAMIAIEKKIKIVNPKTENDPKRKNFNDWIS